MLGNTFSLALVLTVGRCAADDPCADGACGDPLNVSPLIVAGKIKEAREKLKVSDLSEIKSNTDRHPPRCCERC